MLSARNIHKSFGDKNILNGVDLDIAAGTITCVIGPSGTGKTTLLRALALLDYADQGSVNVDGTEYHFEQGKCSPPITRENQPWPDVTTVFQSLFLWPHLTLRENILLPARNSNPKAEADIEGLINFFEMGHFIDSYPNEASIGQRQRVALARALILNPKYLFLDEITSALDIEQTAKILTKLTQLKDRNIGTFLITHHISFAKKAADQVIFMSDGVVAEAGSPDILVSPKTERLQKFLSMVEIAH